MLVVALTGGIGAGKSTAAKLLAALGAHVIDADAISREIVEPGHPALQALGREFGQEILKPDGSLDRAGLASIVFSDDARRQRLNEIMHPRIGRIIADRLDRLGAGPGVAVVDVPLFESAPLLGIQHLAEVVVVVMAPEATRLRHLVERGMDEADAKARIAAQGPDALREEVADVIIRNDGTLEDLESRVGEVWADLTARAGAAPA